MSLDFIFKKNQIVRIRKFKKNYDVPSHWAGTMYDIMGTIVTIRESGRRVTLMHGGFIWHDTDFEKVNTNAI